MQADISLIVAENKYSDQSDPHSIGVISIPWDDAQTHGKLREIIDEMPDNDRIACEKEGVLRLTIDYGYEEDYKSGVGLVLRDLTVDTSKLSDEKEQTIINLVSKNYAECSAENLQSCLDNPDIKRHIVADMNVAGMSVDTFKDAIDTYHAGGDEYPYPLEHKDVENIVSSLVDRNIADIESYYNETAMDIRQEWPSSKDKNFGYDELGKAQVVFFTGFNAVAPTVVKAGQNAYQPAWPSYDDGFDEYDDNGMVRDEDGNMLSSSDIAVDKDYIYHPLMAFSMSLNGTEAEEALDRWILTHADAPLYNGQDKNCLGVAGEVVFGAKYADLVNGVLEKDSENEIKGLKVTNEMLVSGVVSGAELPEAVKVTNIYTPVDLPDTDPHGFRSAFKQIDMANNAVSLTPDFQENVTGIMLEKGKDATVQL